MANKGRFVPPHGHPMPGGPPMLRQDPFSPGLHGIPIPGAFPFDMGPPMEIVDQKLAAQHLELEKLVKENCRLAATHSSLRLLLAAAQQELQGFQGHVEAVKADHDKEMRAAVEKVSKMETDLKSAEAIKTELKQAHLEAQKLTGARQQLMSKVQQLTHDLKMMHDDVQKIPALVSELEAAKQEYHRLRATYDYERKLRVDHYESLQSMEKNYVSMVREVEQLRAELTKATVVDKSGTLYTPNTMQKNDLSSQHPISQSTYNDTYSEQMARSAAGVSGTGIPTVTAPTQPVYDPSRVSTYDASRSTIDDTAKFGYGSSGAGSHYISNVSKSSAVFDPTKVGYDASKPLKTNTSGTPPTVAPSTASNVPNQPNYGTSQPILQYGSAPVSAAYASHAPKSYGSAAAAPQAYYGAAPVPYNLMTVQSYQYGYNPVSLAYGSAPALSSYQLGASAQAQTSYGSSQQLPPAYPSGQGPTPYGNSSKPS